MKAVKRVNQIGLGIGVMASMVLVGLPIQSEAMLPVIDLPAIVQMVKEFSQLKKQYEMLQHTYDNAKSQLNEAHEIAGDAEGHYGFGNLINSVGDLKQREWSPGDWQSALKGAAGGNPARYQQLITQYKSAHPTLSESDVEKGESKVNAQNYESNVQTNQAASVTASYAFNNIKQHMDNIHQLSAQIDQAKNTKAAMDLNTRMQAEMAYVDVQMLKQQALMNEQMAKSQNNSIVGETAEAKFDRLPDAL